MAPAPPETFWPPSARRKGAGRLCDVTSPASREALWQSRPGAGVRGGGGECPVLGVSWRWNRISDLQT